MLVSCPYCPWKGKAAERPTDRWVMCPKCKNKMLVRGTGLMVIPEKPPPIIKIPPAIPRQKYDSDPEIEIEIEPEVEPAIIHDPGLIYIGERIRMYADGRVTHPQWRNREEAKALQTEVKLAIEEAKLAMRILVEEQRQIEATRTIRTRAIGPSLFRYSNKKGTASFLYLTQLIAKEFFSVDSAVTRSELEKQRALTSQVKFNLERIELELRKYLQLGR